MTTSQLNTLQKQGKIQNFTVSKRQQTYKDSSTKPRKDLPVIPAAAFNRSEEKGWLHQNILALCNRYALELKTEHYFNQERKWRFDFFIETQYKKIGIEYEGIMSEKSRHTTVTGYTGDLDKYNSAAVMGIFVLRYSALNYKNAIQDLKEILK